MRKIALLFLIAALVMGGGYYWLSERPAPAPNPAPDPRTAISGAEKVVPKTAPFTRPDPQPVPQDAQRAPVTKDAQRPSAPAFSPPAAARREAAEGPGIYRSLDELVLVTLDSALGRPAAYALFFSRSDQGWSYLCGQPLEQDKTPFDYARSRLKSELTGGQIEDMFCLLAQSGPGGFRSQAFTIGAADNPMSEWASLYPSARSVILGR